MRMFAGLDVGFKRTAVCVVDEAGRSVWRGVVDTHPEALSRALQRWGGKLAKVGLESGSMTPWLARELAKAGFPVVCMDARAAADAVKSRRVKSDKADAYALAEMLRTGWYRAVYVKSEDSHRLKAMLGCAISWCELNVRSAIRCADYCGRLVFDSRGGRGPRSLPRPRIRRCGAITCSTRA